MVGVALGTSGRALRLAWWLVIGAILAVISVWVMLHENTAFGQQVPKWTGADFANNTWRAVRGLLAGQNVYAAGTWIPGIGQVEPVAEHVPATLTWGAPFAALPVRPALLAFTAASLLAIWAGVFILCRPRNQASVLVAVGFGAFAILVAGGPWTLLLGQPTGFALLGLAVVVRARRPWVAALGFMLAASTVQFGLPLALALLVLRQWATVWRGLVMTLAWSLPPAVVGIARVGPHIVRTFASGGLQFLGPATYRVDLGALLHRAGVQSTAAQVGVGLSVLVLALLFLAHLPAELRRIDYPPVLCLVIAVALLCTYHQHYDMLLVGGAAVPASVVGTRSVSMLPIFGLAGISAGLSGLEPVAVVEVPIGLLAIAVLSALAARRRAALDALDSPAPVSSRIAAAAGAAAGGPD